MIHDFPSFLEMRIRELETTSEAVKVHPRELAQLLRVAKSAAHYSVNSLPFSENALSLFQQVAALSALYQARIPKSKGDGL